MPLVPNGTGDPPVHVRCQTLAFLPRLQAFHILGIFSNTEGRRTSSCDPPSSFVAPSGDDILLAFLKLHAAIAAAHASEDLKFRHIGTGESLQHLQPDSSS